MIITRTFFHFFKMNCYHMNLCMRTSGFFNAFVFLEIKSARVPTVGKMETAQQMGLLSKLEIIETSKLIYNKKKNYKLLLKCV